MPSRFRPYSIVITGLSFLLASTGCGPNIGIAAGATSCQAGSAQIRVGDGFLQNICGCQETSTAAVVSPATLTCTVSGTGTKVFFHYIGTRLTHQLGPTSAASVFPASPISDPHAPQPVRVHVVQFNSSGTFAFEDLQNPAMTGRIIVP